MELQDSALNKKIKNGIKNADLKDQLSQISKEVCDLFLDVRSKLDEVFNFSFSSKITKFQTKKKINFLNF